jgi:Glycosyl transferases group 1
VNVLCWHVHGSWTTAFVQGRHRYLLPVTPGPDGPTGGRRPDWPDSAVDVDLKRLTTDDVDVAVVQRPAELDLARRKCDKIIYLEHNTPGGDVPFTRHLMAEQGIRIVHVTHFNALMWDCGAAPTTVIPHGIPDPGYRYTGELERAAVMINEPIRRGRATGTDLLPRFAEVAPVDVFGMRAGGLAEHLGADPQRIAAAGDLPWPRLHAEVARRRVYLHTARWTSLGLSLLEAMALGMPVVALATTEAFAAVQPGTGFLATDVDALVEATAGLIADPRGAAELGREARRVVLRDFGLKAFLSRWDEVLDEEVSR